MNKSPKFCRLTLFVQKTPSKNPLPIVTNSGFTTKIHLGNETPG